jgi:hypothetical protein
MHACKAHCAPPASLVVALLMMCARRCKAGYGTLPGKGQLPCQLCEPGTFSPGGSLEPCLPCGFGLLSVPGASSKQQCKAVNACPIGQFAPEGALDAAECQCYKGMGGGELCVQPHHCQHSMHAARPPAPHRVACTAVETCCHCPRPPTRAGNTRTDPCTICPVGTFSANRGVEKCEWCTWRLHLRTMQRVVHNTHVCGAPCSLTPGQALRASLASQALRAPTSLKIATPWTSAHLAPVRFCHAACVCACARACVCVCVWCMLSATWCSTTHRPHH